MKNKQKLEISPVDGRYASQVEDLAEIFSEYGLVKSRLLVEVEYLLALQATGILPRKIAKKDEQFLRDLVSSFSFADYERVKEIEKTTNHDVKAVEYFMREQMKSPALAPLVGYVHIGRTSEDINNLAYALMLREGVALLQGKYREVMDTLHKFAKEHKKTSMLALTHGQGASPTTFGWEMNVFYARLDSLLSKLEDFKLKAKLNGATGGDNALYVAYPQVNWRKFSRDFIKSMNLENNPFTTQIEPHDTYKELFDLIRGLNLILIDLSRDIWSYISRGVIVQETKAGEVGSSAMPQKVNPIHFENAEGNLGIANALSQFFAEKLPISRMQRDLSDSTVERNFGLVFAHTTIALNSLQKGFSRIKVNKAKMEAELEEHWEVVSEAYQVYMRSLGIEEGYELLKEFTRGKKVDQRAVHQFIDKLAEEYDISAEAIKKLKNITPQNYTGNRDF